MVPVSEDRGHEREISRAVQPEISDERPALVDDSVRAYRVSRTSVLGKRRELLSLPIRARHRSSLSLVERGIDLEDLLRVVLATDLAKRVPETLRTVRSSTRGPMLPSPVLDALRDREH